MRLLKVVLAALFAILAVTVGFVAVAVLAAAFVAYFLGRHLLRRFLPRARPTAPPADASRPPASAAGDVIEVTATEVTPDEHPVAPRELRP